VSKLPAFALFLAFLTLGLGPLSAQSSDENDPGHPFRVNFGAETINLDPQKSQTTEEAEIYTAFYEGLVVYDPLSLRPQPGAAESWAFSKDGKTLTFTLRSGLRFSDDTPLTAQDFVASWIRLLDPATQAPYASLLDAVKGAKAWREGKLTDPSKLGLRAESPTKLVIELNQPAPELVSILCHYAFVPLSASFRKSGQGFPASDGPYVVVSRTPKKWILVKNPLYWDRANVQIPKLVFTFSDDAQKVTEAFKEGNYDWVSDGIDGSAVLSDRLISAFPLFGTTFLYFRVDSKPWNDARVREALWLAAPIQELRKPYIQPTSVLIPTFEGYPSPKGLLKSDKEQAVKLLAQAGYPDGKGLPPVVVALPEGSESDRILELLKSAWTPLGIKVVGKTITGRYYDQIDKTPHVIGYFSWVGDYLDPTTFLLLWKSDSSLNSFGMTDPHYDEILKKAEYLSGEPRLKVLASAEAYLLDKGLLLPLSHSPGFSLIDRESVGGWYPNPLDIHPFKNLYWKALKPWKDAVRFDFIPNLVYNTPHG
jgi:peptide/nickel transport system substrate-binding protein/oligopeptide transport system substrate-binding protein